MTGNRIYRADIDGLRAIAVLSVFFFHINSSWVPGGYTGVDIFIVISGFLITRIIWTEIEYGRFSLREFYIRRIRRILPVFFTFTLITVLVGAVLLLPFDLYNMLTSVQRTAIFTANLYFSQSSGYFDITADEKPMLHMWSLSIEEQYYFVWPVLLLFLAAVASKTLKLSATASKRAVILVTTCFVLFGTIYAQMSLVANPGDAKLYFVLQTRFSELMIGSLAALLPLCQYHLVSRRLGYLGALLISLGLFMLNKESTFPGYNALLPCLGAAFMIYSGRDQRDPYALVHRFLSLRFMTAIGLLSYSLYLWHWPILAYMRYVYGTYLLPWSWTLSAITLAFVLAYLSFHYVEQKFRTMRLTFRQAFFGVFLLPTICIFGLTYALQKARPVRAVAEELAGYGEDVCHGNFNMHCIRGDSTKKPTILMTGDPMLPC